MSSTKLETTSLESYLVLLEVIPLSHMSSNTNGNIKKINDLIKHTGS